MEAGKDPVSKTQVERIDIEKVLKGLTTNYEKLDNTTLNYLLICLAKISVKTPNSKVKNEIAKLLEKMRNNNRNLFLRIKAQQMLDLISLDENTVEEIFEPVPGGAIDQIFIGYYNKCTAR